MRQKHRNAITIPLTFIWIGFICAISFMEAWLKFKAEHVTMNIGLEIGRIVFKSLNRVECVIAIIIFLTMFGSKEKRIDLNLYYFIPIAILLFQTVYLLPTMDARAESILNGQTVKSSNLHLYYIALEVSKVIFLFSAGINKLTTYKEEQKQQYNYQL